MDKNELFAYHQLLVEVHKYCDLELPEEYVEMDVAPEHIHKKKSKHKKSIMLLAENASEKLSGN